MTWPANSISRYHCGYCHQHFAQSSSRDAHQQAHTGSRFVCNACDFQTTQHSTMTRHKQVEHGHPRRGDKGSKRVGHTTRVASGELSAQQNRRCQGSMSLCLGSTPTSTYGSPGASSTLIPPEALPSPLPFMTPSPTPFPFNIPCYVSSETTSTYGSNSMLFSQDWNLPPDRFQLYDPSWLPTSSNLSPLAISFPTTLKTPNIHTASPNIFITAPNPDTICFVDLSTEEWYFMDELKAKARKANYYREHELTSAMYP